MGVSVRRGLALKQKLASVNSSIKIKRSEAAGQTNGIFCLLNQIHSMFSQQRGQL